MRLDNSGNTKGLLSVGNEKHYKRRTKDISNGQATKSTRGMPWHREPKKDVTNCDKLRGAVSGLLSADFRMEQSGKRKVLSSYTEYIGI